MSGVDDASLLARALRAALAVPKARVGSGPALVVDLFTAPLVADLGEEHAVAVAESVLEVPGWSRHGSGGARLVTCTRSEPIADYLREHLQRARPGADDRLTVLHGDPTFTLPVHLRRLAASEPGSRTAHSMALVDPYAMDLPWSFYGSIAPFRRPRDPGDADRLELWLFLRGVFHLQAPAEGRASTSDAHSHRMRTFLGDDPRWVELHEARDTGTLDPFHYQAELLNLLRWKLQAELGYAQTAVYRFSAGDRHSAPRALVIAASGRSEPHLAAVAQVFAAARDGSVLGARAPAKPTRPRNPAGP